MIFERFSTSVLLTGTLLIGQTAWATTYYVDRNLPGSDSYNGTSVTTPFLTIPKCVAVAINPGDTCLVKNGKYPEPVRMVRSGTAGKPITVANYPGHTPHLAMSGYTTSSNRFEIASNVSRTTPISWIVVQGLTISGAYFGIVLTNADNIVLRQNTLFDNQQGILGNGYNFIIDRNRVYHNGKFVECATTNPGSCNKDHGMYLSGTYITITNNLVYDNLFSGIQVAGYPFDPTQHPAPSYTGASNWLVANNTFAYQRYGPGIMVWQSGSTNDRFENNIFYENGILGGSGMAQGIAFYNCGGEHIVRNNVMYGQKSLAGITGSTSLYTASDNAVNVNNPKMRNAPPTLPASPDFSLQPDSPAIDKGLAQSIIKGDFVGALRPQGSGFDIGAYEGASQSGTAPSPPRNLTIF
jgi:parallel beta-helix repeat protein